MRDPRRIQFHNERRLSEAVHLNTNVLPQAGPEFLL